jgi:hypothetical protein
MPGDANGLTFTAAIQIQPFVNSQIIGPSYSKSSSDHGQIHATDLILDNAPGSYLTLPLSDFQDWLNVTVNIPINLSHKVCVWIPFVGNVCQTVGMKFNISFLRSDIFGNLTTEAGSVADEPRFRYCFIPTLSALAINNSSWSFGDIKNIVPTYPYPNDKTVTPFDAICYSTSNNEHPYMDNPGDTLSVFHFLTNELMPGTLYIQNRTFSSTYSNVFEANTIYIGSNVDPVTNRTSIGNVTSDAGSRITFRVPHTGAVILENGCSIQGNVDIMADVNYSNPTFVSTASTVSQTSSVLPFNGSPPAPSITNEENYSIVTITDDDSNVLKSGRVSSEIEYKIPETKIDIYPNPVIGEGKIYLEISKSTKVRANITSMQGVVVKNIIENNYSPGFYIVSFNTGELSKGLYLCNIYYDSNCKTIKLVVQ